MEVPRQEYIRFELTDLSSKALSKTVPARHRKGAVFFGMGTMAMGANAEVKAIPTEVSDAGCPSGLLVPDWRTEQVLPWAGAPGMVVRRVYCEQLLGTTPDSPEWQVVPRTVCRRLLEELRAFEGRGFELLVGGELEFSVCKPEGTTWVPLFDGVDMFATLQNSKAMDFCYEVERNMEQVGVDIQTMNAEYGPGQVEITFAPRFGVEAADATATFRTGTKEIAQQRGLMATFMSKPFGLDGTGNGGHFNFSLWERLESAPPTSLDDAVSAVTAGHRNVFHSSQDPEGLSGIARAFLAGVLAHAPAMEAICSPTPPCYCRHGNLAPVTASWGLEDRRACVRVKACRESPESVCYMELRLPSAAANAYLVTAALVAAGLDGMRQGLTLPPPGDKGAAVLPKSLPEALVALEADAYMVQQLGPDLVGWFKAVKLAEMEQIEARLQETLRRDEDISSVWRHFYFEFV